MMVVISREYTDAETSGCLCVFDGNQIIFDCKTLELPWLKNQHNISCIPAGKYNVIKYVRPDTKKKCFWVKDVPGRTGILIHSGNYATGLKVDTLGCILVGLRFNDINQDGHMDVIDSDKALTTLLTLLPDSFEMVIIN
jgi:hypothetical protein